MLTLPIFSFVNFVFPIYETAKIHFIRFLWKLNNINNNIYDYLI